MLYNKTGSFNTSFGVKSLQGNTSGNYNTSIGYQALTNNLTGNAITTIGYNANVGIDGLANATAIGNGAIVNASNTIQLGNRNVTKVYAGTGTTATVVAGGLQVTGGTLAIGNVLTSDINGVATWQTPAGGGAAGWSLIGNAGTVDGTNFIGTTDNVPFNIRVNNEKAGRIEIGGGNSFYGLRAGNTNTAKFNTGMGQDALAANSLGTFNTAIGKEALRSNTDGLRNTAIGYLSLFSNKNAFQNTAIGSEALFTNATGSNNTANGYNALYFNTIGEGNTAMGIQSLLQNTTGSENVGIGAGALSGNFTGDHNTALGYDADVAGTGFFNASSIGAFAIVNASNKIRLGDVNVSLVETQTAYSPSDGRFKNNVNDTEVKGLEFINLLRPVVYNFDTRKFEEFLTQNMPDSTRSKYLNRDFKKSTSIRQSGFIAQEVETAAKETGYNFNGVHVPETKEDNYSLAYALFTVPLVKAVQELSKQNDDLKKDIAELRSMLTALKSNTIEGSIKITEATTEAKLYQNAPNPFSKTTTIRYSLPSSAKRAAISITTMEGIKIKTFALNSKNGEALNINGGELSAGTYIYTLVVDDVLVDSKKMVLTK
jgi:trimeric autotransporter adhesin